MWFINLNDIHGGGWAYYDVMEGWIGTRLMDEADSWGSLEGTYNIASTEYKNWKGEISLCKIVDGKIVEKRKMG